jgi:hypothetical protein
LSSSALSATCFGVSFFTLGAMEGPEGVVGTDPGVETLAAGRFRFFPAAGVDFGVL